MTISQRIFIAFRTPSIPRLSASKSYLSSVPRVCIVGSGPSAFYTAQFFLRRHNSLHVDMFEKMPAPFGLVRYGVAPDHPDVKNVINTFTDVAKNPRFDFFGNVCVGTDVTLNELRQTYAAVVLAYGASIDRKMNIDGEDHPAVLSAKDLVGWYNGAPDQAQLNPDFNCDTVAVVGMGNVALDVARILLSSTSRLKSTDIPEPVIGVLSTSKVRRVVLLGRRGPLQAAFTLKELRELSRLSIGSVDDLLLAIRLLPEGIVRSSLESDRSFDEAIACLTRPRRRLTQFLLQLEEEQSKHCESPKQLCLQFLRSPLRIVSSTHDNKLEGIELAVNRLTGDPGENQRAVRDPDSSSIEFLKCGLVVRSIGYRSVPIDPKLPFDHEAGVIKSKDSHGRVADSPNEPLNACPLYCTGWVKRGAVGVIVDTAVEARTTAQAVLADLASAELANDPKVKHKPGCAHIAPLLKSRGVRVMSFSDWEKVDALERSSGRALGKPREKLTSVQSMLRAAFSDVCEHKRNV